MRITSKGQVTIPQEIRDAAGLLPQTEVDFELVDGVVRILKRAEQQTRGRDLVAHLKGRGTVRMTTDEIMALSRGEP